MATKGIPKLDGSGRGARANRGRGGCLKTELIGKGGLGKGKFQRGYLWNFIRGDY